MRPERATLVIRIFAGLALLVPFGLLVFVAGSFDRALVLMKAGGALMWLILLLELTGPVALGVLGVSVARRKRASSAPLFVIAALPLVVALLSAYAGMKNVVGVVGDVGNSEQRMRLLAEGLAETMACDVFGGFVTAFTALLACVVAVSAVVTSESGSGSEASGRGATSAGGAWWVATLALAVIRRQTAGSLVLLPALLVAVLAVFAVLAARVPAASRATGAPLIAALSALLAVLSLERALDVWQLSKALDAISRELISTSQRERILEYALAAVTYAPLRYALHGVLGAATYAFAGALRRPRDSGALAAVVLAGALLAGLVGLSKVRTSAIVVALEPRALPADVALPSVSEAFWNYGVNVAYPRGVVVGKNGGGESDPLSSCENGRELCVYADRAATMGAVRTRLPNPSECSLRIAWAVQRPHPTDVAARLGELWPFLGVSEYLGGMVGEGSDYGHAEGVLFVRSLADDAIEIDGRRLTFPPPALGAEETSSAKLERIHYRLRSGETVEHVVRLIEVIEERYRARLLWTTPPAPDMPDAESGTMRREGTLERTFVLGP